MPAISVQKFAVKDEVFHDKIYLAEIPIRSAARTKLCDDGCLCMGDVEG